MGKIAVLASPVADQIAAGEVVERPASVVKELVENALDAGATTVELWIEEGGRALIRVADDGSGMDRDDAVLALSRHATSKIAHAEDLVGVASFGFRGEALPAICSVAQLTVETALHDGAGTRVRADGGVVSAVEEAARRRGTTISVARLFYNAPARQRFLRGPRSEWRAIADVMTTVALTRREIRFVTHHDGKEVMALPPASTLRTRLAALWGARYAEALLDVDDVHGAAHVRGLVERPADAGTATRRVFVSVNGRAVRDLGIVRAAERAYASTIPAGVRPSLMLDVVVPVQDVDVNVHPAKAEVRFRDRWPVERAVELAVRRALGTFDSAASFGPRAWPPAVAPAWGATAVPVGVEMLHADPLPPTPLFAHDAPTETSAIDALGGTSAAASPAPALPQEVTVPFLRQMRNMYILFEREDGMVLIDQHSAHERILYERFLRQLTSGEAPAQRLLFPLTLHLGPAEAEAFDAHRAFFERIGYEVEAFGGHTVLVNAVPTPHARFDAERCLRDTLDALTGDRVAGVHAQHERLAATVACKAAIKAGDPLSLDEMRALFVALATTELPAHDVHGRSTIVFLRWDDIDRRFGRG